MHRIEVGFEGMHRETYNNRDIQEQTHAGGVHRETYNNRDMQGRHLQKDMQGGTFVRPVPTHRLLLNWC